MASPQTSSSGAPRRNPLLEIHRFLRRGPVNEEGWSQLRFPAVTGGEALVLPHRLRVPFARLPEVTQYQIVREPHRVLIRVVLRPEAPVDALTTVREGVRAALQEAGAIAPSIEVEPVAVIEREPGSAKVKLIKSALAPPRPGV